MRRPREPDLHGAHQLTPETSSCLMTLSLEKCANELWTLNCFIYRGINLHLVGNLGGPNCSYFLFYITIIFEWLVHSNLNAFVSYIDFVIRFYFTNLWTYTYNFTTRHRPSLWFSRSRSGCLLAYLFLINIKRTGS